jgi:Uncharacterised nucleotidyltransferase
MRRSRIQRSLGQRVARVLAGAWRESPPPVDFSADELNEVVPLLLGSGAGALGWQRVRHSPLSDTSAALQLREAYRMHGLHSAIHEAEIQQLFTLFRAAGVEPVLVKGWAVARWYKEMWLRPYGDVDLCFAPQNYQLAAAAADTPQLKRFYLDLHDGFAKLDGLSFDDLLARSELVPLGDVKVHVLGFEDQLRILCTHMLRHGAWRPLWLCDIAVAIETRPADFDWPRFLGHDALEADWIACAIGLAHQLLGANVDGTPVAARARQLPNWFVPHVLKNWGAPFPGNYPPMSYSRPLITYLRRPAGLLKTLRARWPDALEATIRLRGEIDDAPRLPYQLGNLMSRFGKFINAMPKARRD